MLSFMLSTCSSLDGREGTSAACAWKPHAPAHARRGLCSDRLLKLNGAAPLTVRVPNEPCRHRSAAAVLAATASELPAQATRPRQPPQRTPWAIIAPP
eukprot:359219-Chlamydomonas_euryale.AAC.20